MIAYHINSLIDKRHRQFYFLIISHKQQTLREHPLAGSGSLSGIYSRKIQLNACRLAYQAKGHLQDLDILFVSIQIVAHSW